MSGSWTGRPAAWRAAAVLTMLVGPRQAPARGWLRRARDYRPSRTGAPASSGITALEDLQGGEWMLRRRIDKVSVDGRQWHVVGAHFVAGYHGHLHQQLVLDQRRQVEGPADRQQILLGIVVLG